MSDQTPAGWFPDHQDQSQMRFWDGSRWTDACRPRTPQESTPDTAPSVGSPGAPPQPTSAGAAPEKKNWFLRHKILTGVLALVAIIAIATASGSGGGSTSDTAGSGTQHHDAKKPSPPTKPTPSYTVAQQQAIKSAQSYLDLSGFSRAGLIQQLTSKAGEGFKMADAVFAVNHTRADYNKEAVESAKSYLQISSFSRASLIQQLSSKAGEQFTLAQATYAANQVGL